VRGLERIADSNLRVRGDQSRYDRSPVDWCTINRRVVRAPLSGRTDGAEQHGGDDEIGIGVGRHDDRIVARAFEQDLAESRGDALCDVAPHADEPVNETSDTANRRRAAVATALSHTQSVKIGGRSSASTIRFASIARQALSAASSATASTRSHCRTPRPASRSMPIPRRKVERGEHADDAERMPCSSMPMPRTLGRHRLAVEHPRLTDREVGDVDHFLHFAVALCLDLAVLERDERAERVFVRAPRASPNWRTASPRRGAGTFRHARAAFAAASMAA
jgi:hypothetical protein